MSYETVQVFLGAATDLWRYRKFSGASLPPVMNLRSGQGLWVTIDVPAVLEEIKAEARRFAA